jgi:hypothetical protein
MLQASEVRKGNIVRYYEATESGAHLKQELPVDGIKFWSGFAHVQVDGNWRPLNIVEPVGLSDSWLDRFGFEYLTSTYGVRDLPKTYGKFAKLFPGIAVEIVKDQDDRYFRFIQLSDHEHGLEDVPLFFVRQLQNHCFDLTGAELTADKQAEDKILN